MAKKLVAEQMVLTANRLADGRVIYLGADGWTIDLDEARIVRGAEEAEGAEEAGRKAVADRILVEPYLIEVVTVGGGVEPARLREKIRCAGPTTGHSRSAA
ncbi:DUF2849 domain-containing protein [Lutibaculum baratangense]|uniref:DUF2849 domain-containing protein n=1 Tax=Lutibaculum baratangense AMV1 TaxID=631454 RepID=V4RHU0_9HYPH|nr:DUF2849 domain-containing protein [Lutibaculum baratangense]ESR22835.1 Conserved hypothetical protein probably involved in sulfate reduction [Lutibaculum baratangense AMV1]